jgi:hypothetical protein
MKLPQIKPTIKPPEGFIPDEPQKDTVKPPEGFIPTIENQKAEGKVEPSLGGQAWNKIWEPIETLSKPLRDFSNKLTDPSLQKKLGGYPLFFGPGGKLITAADLAAFAAGAIGGESGSKDQGNLGLTGFTSPGNIALMVASMGEGAAAKGGMELTGAALRGLRYGVGIPSVLEGGTKLLTEDSWGGQAQGLSELAMGGLLLANGPRIRPRPSAGPIRAEAVKPPEKSFIEQARATVDENLQSKVTDLQKYGEESYYQNAPAGFIPGRKMRESTALPLNNAFLPLTQAQRGLAENAMQPVTVPINFWSDQEVKAETQNPDKDKASTAMQELSDRKARFDDSANQLKAGGYESIKSPTRGAIFINEEGNTVRINPRTQQIEPLEADFEPGEVPHPTTTPFNKFTKYIKGAADEELGQMLESKNPEIVKRATAELQSRYGATKKEPPEGRSFARMDDGTYKANVDSRLMDVLAAAHADKAPRELIQNAWDATKSVGPNRDIQIDLSNDAQTLIVTDNGPGLNKEELGTLFIDPGLTGKANDPTSSGEFGVGKTSYTLSGDLDVSSTIRDPKSGLLREFYFSSTPQTMREGFKIFERAPTHPETGMRIKFKSIKPLESVKIWREVNGLYGNEGNVKFTDNNSYWGTERKLESEYTNHKVIKFERNEADYHIVYDPKSKAKGETALTVAIKINGMPHREADFNVKGYNVPYEVIVNITPKYPATSDRYPTNIDRTQLKPDVQNEITNIIKQNILKPGQEEEINALRKAWSDAVPVKLPNGLDIYIFDEEGHLSPENQILIANSPVFKQMGTALTEVTASIFESITNAPSLVILEVKDIITNHARLGFTFTPTSENRWGVNFPNPDSPGKFASVIDLPWSLASTHSPNQFLTGILNTLKHELAHNVNRPHDNTHELVINELDRLLADILPEVMDSLRGGFLDANGQPHAELSEILQQVDTDSRKRVEPEFTLAGTGVYSKGQTDGPEIPKEPNAGSNKSRDVAIEKFKSGISRQVELRKQQEALYSKERAIRIAKAMGVKGGGESKLARQLAALRGKMPRVPPEPLNMSNPEFTALLDHIDNSPAVRGYENIRARVALAKMITGSDIPQKNEILTLGKVFGTDFSNEVMFLYAGLGGVPGEGSKILNVANASRSLLTTYDLSFTARQAAGLAYTPEYWAAWGDLWAALKDENAYLEVNKYIQNHPKHELAMEAGLRLTDFESLATREEYSQSTLPTSKFGRAVGMHATNRANLAFINKLRMDVFSRMIDELGVVMNSTVEAKDLPLAEQLAQYINNATGRGTTKNKTIEAGIPLLNQLIFSPRFQISRFQLIQKALSGPTYTNLDPRIRKMYLNSLMSISALWMTGLGLLAIFGASIETDPTSSDFMKARFGATRVDFGQGFQQPLVLAARLLLGETKSSTTGETTKLGAHYGSPNKLTVAGRFLQSKSAPIPSLVMAMLQGTDFRGQPVSLKIETIKRLVPIILQDLWDIATTDPGLFPLFVLAEIGVGLQTYANTDTNEYMGTTGPVNSMPTGSSAFGKTMK